ncbi:MAG: energy-coupling factor transporter transmembrane component T [Candidatus Promineifilaceae bacterium]|nr:energy-coupling factor transporter transmembrane component T [Candidatus Promineifilaceae bacterium]
MIGSRDWPAATAQGHARLHLGTAGHLSLLLWSLASVFLVGPSRTWMAALIVLTFLGLIYPHALRRALRLRWLLLVGLMALPSLFLPGPPAVALGPVSLSAEGLQIALRVAARALVILVAVESFTGAVDVVEIAALFERAGLNGVGFALGVALNLLPILRDTASTTWHSLRMRGGLRRQPLRGLRFYLVTVVSSAVRRAGDIALAAEARAFTPGRQRAAPLKLTLTDALVFIGGAALFLVLLFA